MLVLGEGYVIVFDANIVLEDPAVQDVGAGTFFVY